MPFAIFIRLGGQTETSVVFGRTSHGVTSLQAEKLTRQPLFYELLYRYFK